MKFTLEIASSLGKHCRTAIIQVNDESWNEARQLFGEEEWRETECVRHDT